MSSVIVTGASGFIGTALVKSLRRAGHEVIPLDHGRGDVATAEYWRSVPPADHLVHLAGRSFVPDSWTSPSQFIATNATGTARAVEYCGAAGAHLVFVSAYIYGVPQRLPIAEDHPIAPNNPYALSKALAEQICRFHADIARLPVTIIRPFNIFGPGQRPEFLIATIFEQISRGVQIRVKDLSPRRDYLFVDDFVGGVERTLAAPGGLRVFNFGSGASYTVKDIIELAQAAAGSSLPVTCDDEQRANEIPDVRADIGLARRLLGWEPRFFFLDGLKLTFRSAQGPRMSKDMKEATP
jgi:nucleoside-diphosphate-sugar epimerase